MQSTLDETALNQRIKISEYLNKLKSKTPSNDFNNTVHIADNANEKKSEQTPSNVSVPLAPINQITSVNGVPLTSIGDNNEPAIDATKKSNF